jgi:putative endonuclease
MKLHQYYIYILTNVNNTVLYTGVTNDLVRRVFEHKKKIIQGFTSKYNVDKLVYFELFDYIDFAIKREKQIKGYSRKKKDILVNSLNPRWDDLYCNDKIDWSILKRINGHSK